MEEKSRVEDDIESANDYNGHHISEVCSRGSIIEEDEVDHSVPDTC